VEVRTANGVPLSVEAIEAQLQVVVVVVIGDW
jgi:hypothetical protein